jgi:succinate dehydrogenase / fumarate reductase cytochrome b subunit
MKASGAVGERVPVAPSVRDGGLVGQVERASAMPVSTSAVLRLWSTAIGKKAVMAATGIVLVGFVIGHMLGNLKIYQGEVKFDAYAAFLREAGSPVLGHEQVLWIARLVLLAAVVLHVTAAWQLTRMSWAARPVGYGRTDRLEAGYAARTMRWGGVILGLFVVYHILHFTLGVVGYAPGEFQPSVYRNVVAGFSVWYVSAFYIAAMMALGSHLYHGIWSMFQTFGVSDIRASGVYRGLAVLLSLAVVAGNVSIPVAVLSGWIQ